MSKIKSVAVVVAALACVGLGYAPSASAQTVPLTLTQQGRLLDSTGAPVDGVQLTFTFTLYTSATGGTGVWTENQAITPDKGYFSAKLGDTTAFPATIFDGSKPALYLGIKIGSDAEMAPRQALTSVPFALLALNALNATHAAKADQATNATNAATAAVATNATNADHATAATKADSATTAQNANQANTIGNNINSNSVSGTTTASAPCPTGYSIPTGGSCTNVSGGGSLQNAGFNIGKSYQCTCTGCTSIEATIVCAK